MFWKLGNFRLGKDIKYVTSSSVLVLVDLVVSPLALLTVEDELATTWWAKFERQGAVSLKGLYMTFRTSSCQTRAHRLRPKQMAANGHTSFKLNRNKIKLTKTAYKQSINK